MTGNDIKLPFHPCQIQNVQIINEIIEISSEFLIMLSAFDNLILCVGNIKLSDY